MTEGLSFKLDSKERKLVIEGTAQEINQFLDRLEGDYNTSKPASSVDTLH